MAAIDCNLHNMGQLRAPAQHDEKTSEGSPLSIVRMMIGDCFGPIAQGDSNGSTALFVQLHGIEFIGLGAVTDELSAKERVYDTLEQIMTERAERLISIGYLVNNPTAPEGKSTKTIPLELWSKNIVHDRAISRSLRRTISSIKVRGNNNIAVPVF